jgi:hypothetical protein
VRHDSNVTEDRHNDPARVDGSSGTRPAVPRRASGRTTVVATATAPTIETLQRSADTVWSYRVDIEIGLPIDGGDFAADVAATLQDPRGWRRHGHAFRQVAGPVYDFRVVLASPALTDLLCAPLSTDGEVSCRNGDDVVLNALRWCVGADSYGDDVTSYRQYLVNHEVGHRLGHRHADCPGTGRPAPVMMQQTLGLQGCQPNPWP